VSSVRGRSNGSSSGGGGGGVRLSD